MAHGNRELIPQPSSSNFLNVSYVILGAKKICVVEGKGDLSVGQMPHLLRPFPTIEVFVSNPLGMKFHISSLTLQWSAGSSNYLQNLQFTKT